MERLPGTCEAAEMGGARRRFAKSDCSEVRNETNVRENNWRLMLIIKLSNESISFSPVDGFSLSSPGVVVHKPNSIFHLPLLLRTKHSMGCSTSSRLPRRICRERVGTITFNILPLRGSSVPPLPPSVCKTGFRNPGAGWVLLTKVFSESDLGFVGVYSCAGGKGLETGAPIMPHFLFLIPGKNPN